MKTLNQVILAMLMLIIAVSTSFANTKNVTLKINQYLIALNQKAEKTIDNFVNDETNFTMFNSIIGKKEVLSESDYLKFVKDGRAGAWVTSTKVKSVDQQGNLAVAYIEYEGKSLIRKEYLTLVNLAGKWEIINSVSSLSKK